jgi:arabinogalactan endo-1,4-beta-galactosidase
MMRTILAAVLLLQLQTSCKKQPTVIEPPKTQDSIVNSGFESDQKESSEVTGWLTSENDPDADAIAAGGYEGSYALQHKKATAYKVRTYQELSGLANGYYQLTAYIQNSGGQNACYISGKGVDGFERMTSSACFC